MSDLFACRLDRGKARTGKPFLPDKGEFFEAQPFEKRYYLYTVDEGGLRKSPSAPRLVFRHTVEKVERGFVYKIFGRGIVIIIESRRYGYERSEQYAVVRKMLLRFRNAFFSVAYR